MKSKWENDDETDEEHWNTCLTNILTLQSKEQHKETTKIFETIKVMLKQKYPAKVLNKVMKQIGGMAEKTHFRAFVCAVQGMYSLKRTFHDVLHYHLEVQANPRKIVQKNDIF